MNNDLKNILSHLNKDAEQEKLLQYLNDHLNNEEKHEVEKQMADDEFVNDAIEGLQQTAADKISYTVKQLNARLVSQLSKNEKRKANRFVFQQSWIFISIILLILLCVIGYFVITKMNS